MPRKSKDPHAEREAEKYANPIPSREFILSALEEAGCPMHYEQLLSHFRLRSEEKREALRRRLRAMERDGQIIKNRQGGYGLVEKMQLLRGRIQAHRDGYGFLIPDEGGDDLFISARAMRQVMNGDLVLARLSSIDTRGRQEGEVVEILERGQRRVLGRYLQEAGMGLIKPQSAQMSQDILVPPSQEGGACPGQWVVAEITVYPSQRFPAMARIIEILGEPQGAAMAAQFALRTHDIPFQWPDDLREELSDFSSEQWPDRLPREDLRALPFVTIDGEDSRDFDDAVYACAHREGFSLYVAIADVSHYVRPGTRLDEEASLRATSVYFPTQVVPMLPEVLSNDLCSLKPGVDRLALVCAMEMSPQGALHHYRFFPALIHSHARLTYHQVSEAIEEGDPEALGPYAARMPELLTLHRLFEGLLRLRHKRGAIEFETRETQFLFDEQQRVSDIVPKTRRVAHRMIEECMLLANVCAADYLKTHDIPALYRVHTMPDPGKIEDLRVFLGAFGLRLAGGDVPRPKHFAEVLHKAQGKPEAQLIQTVLLRSMMQATYTPEVEEHFGLAYEAYTHFTSPIRRYPDLLVHRAIMHGVSGQSKHDFPYSASQLKQLGGHCSMAERRADQASWDVIAWLKCDYMLDRIGSDFEGLITSVTHFGFFVELLGVYVEGLVHVSTLADDYYTFDPVHYTLSGSRTGRVFSIGHRVCVRLTRVDRDERKIDLMLRPMPGSEFSHPEKSRSSSKKSSRGGTQKAPSSRSSASSSGQTKKTSNSASPKRPSRRKKTSSRRD